MQAAAASTPATGRARCSSAVPGATVTASPETATRPSTVDSVPGPGEWDDLAPDVGTAEEPRRRERVRPASVATARSARSRVPREKIRRYHGTRSGWARPAASNSSYHAVSSSESVNDADRARMSASSGTGGGKPSLDGSPDMSTPPGRDVVARCGGRGRAPVAGAATCAPATSRTRCVRDPRQITLSPADGVPRRTLSGFVTASDHSRPYVMPAGEGNGPFGGDGRGGPGDLPVEPAEGYRCPVHRRCPHTRVRQGDESPDRSRPIATAGRVARLPRQEH